MDKPREFVVTLPDEPDADGYFRATFPAAVAIGEQCAVGVTGAATALWQLPFQAIVGGYQIGLQSGSTLPPPPATSLRAVFYFHTAGTYLFQGTGTLPSGQPWIVNCGFLVSSPTGQVSATFTGAAGYYPAPDRLSLGQADASHAGIQFNANVVNVTPDPGQVAFLQLAKPSRVVTTAAGSIPCPINGQLVVDSVGPSPFYGATSPIAVGQTLNLANGDRPSLGLGDMRGQTLTGANVSAESFQMFLMFQPATPNAIWVPVAVLNWDWSAAASRLSGGAWAGFGGSQHATSGIPSEFPQWSDYSGDPNYLDWGNWSAA